MSVPVELPELTADEAAHSAELVARIRETIRAAGGWIDFAQFMQLALYAPGLGYYSAGARKFGADGDFITAPEVAPVFSRCVAVQCAEVLRNLATADARILELGAGSGVMAAELLAELERQGSLPQEYLILDLSADLRERQQATIAETVPHLLERVRWLDGLPDEESFTGLVIANEVLDALTVQRFAIRGGEVNALGVSDEFGELVLAEVRGGERLVAAVRQIERDAGVKLPDGYESEVCLGLSQWLAAIGASLERGVMLFVDYGLPRREYYAPERTRGTLLCHCRHRFHDDALVRVGLQDITAWVDFTAVAAAAELAGYEVAGYTTQAHFLIGTGLGEFVANVEGLDLVQRLNLSRQAMVLTLPGEMGERFKVIALSRNYDAPLRGFATRDLRHTL
jgi:SAM-dependent MidA family methyltransferase